MNRSPLSLTNEVRFCVSGTVTIHPTAAIASNVILRANPGSRLIIGPGVVIGKGCVLHAYQGSLVLEAEVTLGSQVILAGHGTVGKGACVGSMATLMTTIGVSEGASIPPRSLIGAPEPHVLPPPGSSPQSRASTAPAPSMSAPVSGSAVSPTPSPESIPTSTVSPPSPIAPRPVAPQSPNASMPPLGTAAPQTHSPDLGASRNGSDAGIPQGQSSGKSDRIGASMDEADKNGVANEMAHHETANGMPSTHTVVYGKASVHRLMTMMFPYRTLTNTGDDKE